MTSSSSDTRGSTNLGVYFNLPTAAGVMTAADYLTVSLPFNWGRVAAMDDNTWSGSATLTKDVWDTTVVPATNTPVSIAVTASILASNVLRVVMDVVDPVVTLAEATNYTLTINGVPTPEEAANCNVGSLVLGVGKAATGGVGSSNG